MANRETTDWQAAAEEFERAVIARRLDDPMGHWDLYLECRIAMPRESIDVLPGQGNGLKPGYVERRVILRYGSQEGQPVLDVHAADLPRAVQILTRGVQAGLPLDPTIWQAWLWANLRQPPGREIEL